jgi:hypothetical protein
MNVLTWFLSALFTYVMFPLVVVGTFGVLVVGTVGLVSSQSNEQRQVRAGIAATVPVVTLVFLHVMVAELLASIGNALASVSVLGQILSGAVLGIILTESVHWLKDLEGLVPFYALVLSSLAMLMVLLFMSGQLKSVSFIIFGAVVVTALYISLFRGLPDWHA